MIFNTTLFVLAFCTPAALGQQIIEPQSTRQAPEIPAGLASAERMFLKGMAERLSQREFDEAARLLESMMPAHVTKVFVDWAPVPRASRAALFLMYDVHGRGQLGPTEPFIVQFDVVEGGVFEHYEVRIFGNDLVEVDVDGVPLPFPFEGIEGNAGVSIEGTPLIELSVPLKLVYSPDTPLFWSASVDSRKPQGSGDPVVSALITFAGSDGKTTVAPVGTTNADGSPPDDANGNSTGAGCRI